MTDLALVLGQALTSADAAIAAGDFVADDGLETAVLISLFSDARADDDDVLPQPGGDRRGWWGDMGATVDGDQLGSKLWLLSREKQLTSVLSRAEAYARDALQWLIDDGVASAVTAVATFPRPGWLSLVIEIARPGGPARRRFDYAWRFTEAALR